MNHIKAPSLFLLIMLVSLPQMGETIYTPALADLAASFQINASQAQATLTLFLAGFAPGVFFWGFLSDRIGRRPAMLIGLGVYLVGCFICITVNTYGFLLFGRFIQAFGAATCSILTQTMAREAFQGTERSRVFSTIGMFIPFSAAIGPVIGGWTTTALGWHANFIILLFLGLLIFFWSAYRLPETRIPSLSPDNRNKPNLLKLAAKLFTDKTVIGYALIVGASNGILFSFYAEAPFIFIQHLGLSSGQYGSLCMLIISGSIGGGLLGRWLMRCAWASRKLLALGLILCASAAIAMVLFMQLTASLKMPYLTVTLITFSSIIIFAGFNLIISNALQQALNNYHHVLGSAGAWFSLTYYVLTALAVHFLSILRTGTMTFLPFYIIALSIVAVSGFILTAPKQKA